MASEDSASRICGKMRVAEDLIKLWAGHSNKDVTDGYVRLADDEQFRRSSVEQCWTGFSAGNGSVVPQCSPHPIDEQ